MTRKDEIRARLAEEKFGHFGQYSFYLQDIPWLLERVEELEKALAPAATKLEELAVFCNVKGMRKEKLNESKLVYESIVSLMRGREREEQ